MTLNKEMLSKMLLGVAGLWSDESARLSEIDSKFGDGDHGVTIKKIAELIKQAVDEWGDKNIREFFLKLGKDIMGVSGGSAGPLYGTMIGGLAAALAEESQIDGALLKAMFQGSLLEMQEITTAKVGDKTMMDSLIPAVAAATDATDDIGDVLRKAEEAACRGAKESENYVSKFGRAKSYKEQTIGTPDAGAVSTALFFAGLKEGFEGTR